MITRLNYRNYILMEAIIPMKLIKTKIPLLRKSVVLAFKEGIVEPVQKIVYPDLSFEKKNG